jgi:hypothetical protein
MKNNPIISTIPVPGVNNARTDRTNPTISRTYAILGSMIGFIEENLSLNYYT